ncbi:hypothetical protein ACSBR1_023227 [Camellia fascicularis]
MAIKAMLLMLACLLLVTGRVSPMNPHDTTTHPLSHMRHSHLVIIGLAWPSPQNCFPSLLGEFFHSWSKLIVQWTRSRQVSGLGPLAKPMSQDFCIVLVFFFFFFFFFFFVLVSHTDRPPTLNLKSRGGWVRFHAFGSNDNFCFNAWCYNLVVQSFCTQLTNRSMIELHHHDYKAHAPAAGKHHEHHHEHHHDHEHHHPHHVHHHHAEAPKPPKAHA